MDTNIMSLIVSLISVSITAILGPIAIAWFNHKLKKQDEEQKQRDEDIKNHQLLVDKAYNEELRKERLEDFKSVIEPFQDEVRDEIKDIKEQLEANTKANVTGLRCDMKDLRDRYVDRGYATSSEKSAFQDLYDDYKGLGGNHFKNYVDGWKDDIEALPTELEVPKKKKSTSKTKKTVLVEHIK